MQNAPSKSEKLMDVAIRRCIILPSAQIYQPPAGFYDYGPVGCAIKKRIEELWRAEFLRKEGFHEIETSIILPEAVLEASGHAKNFSDPVASCKKCGAHFRADHLIADSWNPSFGEFCPDSLSAKELGELIKKLGIRCPNDKGELGEVWQFNMMFKTHIGAGQGKAAYCRPETAQGIFLNFSRIIKNYGSRLPIGIGQAGKSFRNEISPRQGILRGREFSQMELEYFFNPKEQSYSGFEKVKNETLDFELEDKRLLKASLSQAVQEGIVPNEIMAYFLWKQKEIYLLAGIPEGKIRFRKIPKESTPHYSKCNIDMVVETSYGWIETTGTAYRTDYDLSTHSQHSGEDLSVFVDEEKAKVMPHVIEPSMGVDRMLWCVLEHCFREKGQGKDWDWFDFPPCVAPYHAWVFPLMKKDGLDAKAREIEAMLRGRGFLVWYQETGSIGRRYARADEIGVPYCITVDYETLKDDTATIRFRNDGGQIRLKIGELADKITAFSSQRKVSLS